jgi:hypothetical protein
MAANCGPAQACDNGHCRDACASSADCGVDGLPYCDEARAVCVQCLGDANCGGDQPYCDVTAGRCVECLTDVNCGGTGTPYCRPEALRCVQCLTDANCGPDSRCDNFECN